MAGITLAQLAQVETDPMKKFIELMILRECKVMQTLPFENVTSLKVGAQWWETLPTGGAWRSLNEGYSSSEDGQLGGGEEALFGFGTDITFDRVLEQVKNVVRDPIQLQTEGKLKSMTLDWNYAFINGDPAVDPKQFAGLKKRVAALPARQTINFTAGATDAALDPTASAANARRFFDILEQGWRYCNQGRVSEILCNEDFILGLARACRYMQTQGNFLDVTQDTFGRDLVTWRGKPLTDMGMKKDMSTEVMGYEAGLDGTASAAMSVYMASYDPSDGLYGIQLNDMTVYDPLNGGEMETKPSKLRRVDWWNGLANFGRYSIVRLRNLEKLALWT
jgi:hypothetical protein